MAAAFREDGIAYAYGYGPSGPISIPIDTRVATAHRREDTPYGNVNSNLIGALGLFGVEPMGAPPPAQLGTIGEEEAAAWAASVTPGSMWHGVAVGLTVWVLTKVLDRVFSDHDRKRRAEPEEHFDDSDEDD